MFYELYILTGGLYLTFVVLVRASLHKREGALLSFIGFVILYGTANKRCADQHGHHSID